MSLRTARDAPPAESVATPAHAPIPLPAPGAQPGGFYGWRLLFFLWIVYTLPIGFAYYSPAVLYPFMIHELGWSRGQTMAGATGLFLAFGLGSPLAALLIARLGARRTIAAGAALIVAAGGLLIRLGHLYPAFVVLLTLVGLGVSLSSMIPVQTVAIAWFHSRRALALGLVLGGGAIGGFLAPQLISRAVAAAGGNWRVGWAVIACAAAGCGLVALASVRNRPEDLGQQPDGKAPTPPGTPARPDPRPSRTYRTTDAWTLPEALRTSSLWLLVLGAGGGMFLWQMMVTQGPLHLQDRGFAASQAAFFYSLALGLSIVGRFTMALLGDHIEPRWLYAGGILCVLVGGILFWFVSPALPWVAYLYPLLAGFGFGMAYVSSPTLMGNYWGPEVFAGLSGVISPVSVLIQGCAAPLAGVVFDLQHSYLPAVLIAWAGAAAGFVAILLCRPPRRVRC